MTRVGGHPGLWLAAALWAGAGVLDLVAVAATLAAARPEAPALGSDPDPSAGPRGGRSEEPPSPREAAPPVAEADRTPPGERARPAASARAAEPLEPSPAPEAARSSRPSTVVHAVAPGESLMSVTRGYLGTGARWREVVDANDISPPYVLEPGRALRIPMARSVRSEARLRLVPPRGPERERAAPNISEADANRARAGSFAPLDEGLRLESPLAEAYPWGIPGVAALGFSMIAFAAAVIAVAGAEGRLDPAHAARSLWWGAASAGGACAFVAGLAILAAGPVARSPALQLGLAATAAAAAGAAGYHAARMTPGGDPRRSRALARRFGVATGWLVASALASASMTGWLPSALAALRLPG